MDVHCPRCRAELGPDADRCPSCGLDADQLEQLLATAPHAAPIGPGPGALAAGPQGYWTDPVYGRGPTSRGMGYAPPPPRLSDLRRPDTSVDLTGDEPRVVIPGTHATQKPPPAPAPPRLRAQARTNRTAELVVCGIAALVAAVIVLLAVF